MPGSQKWTNARLSLIVAVFVGSTWVRAAEAEQSRVEQMVGAIVRPVMEQNGIPGLAVGIVRRDQIYVLPFGIGSRTTGQPVTARTLFEIGSDSKTFTATLAAWAVETGQLSLSDRPGQSFPELRGTAIDQVSVLHLGTHTPGGFPLQLPDSVTNHAQLMAYFQQWKPAYPPGAYRTYANPSVGLFGMIAAQSFHQDFVTLMEEKLLPGLGLKHTYLRVPAAEQENYAQGYTAKDQPTRMSAGELAPEADGIRTTAGDLARFIQANLGLLPLDESLQRAIFATHTGYYRVGAMTQDLIWEQYVYPVALSDVLAGNSAQIAYHPNPVAAIIPPLQPQQAVLINKTGSTNGFGAYLAFIPVRKIGVVLLANKNYPMDARVTAAYTILTHL